AASQRVDPRLVQTPPSVFVADVNLQRRQPDFLGYVSRGEEPLAPATQTLVEEVEETMQTCSERLEGTRAGKGQRRQPYPGHGQGLSHALENQTLLDTPISQVDNRYWKQRDRCHMVINMSFTYTL